MRERGGMLNNVGRQELCASLVTTIVRLWAWRVEQRLGLYRRGDGS